MRVTKDPEVRRRELIGAAEELFREKGCEETSVSDIVRKVGVAQGTFYYYFRSKDAILDAVLDHYLDDHLEPAIRSIMADGSLDTMEKIRGIVRESLAFQTGEKKVLEFLLADRNLPSRHKYMLKVRDTFVPVITGILEEGVAEGTFTVPYPRETAELLLVMFTYLHETAANGDYGRKIRAAEGIVARVLGLKEKNITFNI